MFLDFHQRRQPSCCWSTITHKPTGTDPKCRILVEILWGVWCTEQDIILRIVSANAKNQNYLDGKIDIKMVKNYI